VHYPTCTFSTPASGLILGAKGVLFGVTDVGGISNPSCAQGCGTVFQMEPPTGQGGHWTETTIYQFTGQNGDGNGPKGLVAAANGVLYGATAGGGSSACPNGCGTIFKLTPPSSLGGPWTETVVYSFQGGSDSSTPTAGLAIDKTGAIYGTTNGYYGALGQGTVFQFIP
jgi:uncharacterized repeat protein (TIGR03803 family)